MEGWSVRKEHVLLRVKSEPRTGNRGDSDKPGDIETSSRNLRSELGFITMCHRAKPVRPFSGL
jgi:hypothetical protein